MIEPKAESSEDTKVAAKDDAAIGGDDSTAPSYPYLQILQQLQAKAAQDPTADNQQLWDLSTDALLATLLHEFSRHVASRTFHVASDIRNLQNSVNEAGVDVAVCQTEWMKRSADIFMEQVVGEDESEEEEESEREESDGDEKIDKSSKQKEEQHENDHESDDSSDDIARLEAEEKSAIEDGMKALDLFYDPRRPTNSSGGSDGSSGERILLDAEEDIIGENCYHYPAAEGDVFNQRPLPFIVGSREFMESSCAGLGGEKQREG